MSEDIRVHMRHVRNPAPHGAGLCVRGAKAWFDARGLSFRDFLDNGLPIAQVDSFKDAVADRVAAAARQEHADKEALNHG